MKIVTVSFDADSSGKYQLLYDVFKTSVIKYSTGTVNFRGIHIPAPDFSDHHIKACVSNSAKLFEWLAEMEGETDNICFMDCDMIITQDISSVFNMDFDIAFTKRAETCRLPVNGGAVFVKPNERSREFMQLWYDVNMRMYHDIPFHKPWREKYGGMNQAALGYILEQGGFSAHVIKIPCREWNACDDDWAFVDNNTKIIHIKGKLRWACFGEMPVMDTYRTAYNLWTNLKNEYEETNKGC